MQNDAGMWSMWIVRENRVKYSFCRLAVRGKKEDFTLFYWTQRKRPHKKPGGFEASRYIRMVKISGFAKVPIQKKTDEQQAWLQDRDAAGQFYARHSTLWPSARQGKNFQSEGTAYVCHERGSRKVIHTPTKAHLSRSACTGAAYEEWDLRTGVVLPM